jgi:hypothetical protein
VNTTDRGERPSDQATKRPNRRLWDLGLRSSNRWPCPRWRPHVGRPRVRGIYVGKDERIQRSQTQNLDARAQSTSSTATTWTSASTFCRPWPANEARFSPEPAVTPPRLDQSGRATLFKIRAPQPLGILQLTQKSGRPDFCVICVICVAELEGPNPHHRPSAMTQPGRSSSRRARCRSPMGARHSSAKGGRSCTKATADPFLLRTKAHLRCMSPKVRTGPTSWPSRRRGCAFRPSREPCAPSSTTFTHGRNGLPGRTSTRTSSGPTTDHAKGRRPLHVGGEKGWHGLDGDHEVDPRRRRGRPRLPQAVQGEQQGRSPVRGRGEHDAGDMDDVGDAQLGLRGPRENLFRRRRRQDFDKGLAKLKTVAEG